MRASARAQLFALALETPGGLKVQTIHAFCTRLLHQFPFEANVAARFEVLDERRRTQLLETLRSTCCSRPPRTPASPLGRALATAIAPPADQTFRERDQRGDRRARRDRSAGSTHAGGVDGARSRNCRAALGDRARRQRSRRSKRESSSASCHRRIRNGRAIAPRLTGAARKTDQGQGDALRCSRAASRRERLDALSRRCSAPAELQAAQDHRHQARSSEQHPALCPAAARRAATASATLLERRRAVEMPRPHRRAAHHRARRDRALPRREGPARPARLRRPDRQDAAACSTRVVGGLGALQARSRHRPCADRRGAGHQPEAMGDRRKLVAEFFAGAGARGD